MNKEEKRLQGIIDLVHDWREAFGLKTNGFGTEDEIKLSNELIREELDEWMGAFINNDTIEMLDANADLIFVLTQRMNMIERVDMQKTNLMFGDLNTELNIPGKVFNFLSNPTLDNYTLAILDINLHTFEQGVDLYDLVYEVYLSNMSKVCKDESTAIETIKWYEDNKGVETYYKQSNKPGYFNVHRKEDDKVLKSIDFIEPNIAKLLLK